MPNADRPAPPVSQSMLMGRERLPQDFMVNSVKPVRRIVIAGVGVSLAAVAILLSFWSVLAQTPAFPSAAQQANPAQVSPPSEPPAAARGSLLFQQNCAPCHGDTGWADGPTAADLPNPATAFADPDSIWDRTPAELFHVTKFGRIEQLMPPWENRMDDRQIWQTVFYAWSLHVDEAALEEGRTLYGEQCAACHGLQGEGDGPEVGTLEAGVTLPSFADPDYAMTRSQADWHAGWQRAHADVGAEWSPAEQQQVLEAVRAFSYVPPWQPIAMHGDGVITGQVAAGTAGLTLPDNLVATLETYLQFEPVDAVEVPLDDAGAFRFEGLALDPDVAYLVTVEYAGIRYSSPVLSLTDEQQSVDTDIFIYEGTSDPTGLVIDRVNWVIEPQQDGLLVGQILTFGYTGDRTFTGSPVEGLEVEGSVPHVTVGLYVPSDAQNVVLENGIIGGRYHRQGDIIYDTVPIGPGEATHQLVVRYLIPVDDEPLIVTSDYLYPVRRLNLLAAELPDVTIDAPRLEHLGVQEVQGANFIIWQALDLAAEPVSVQFNGLSTLYRPPATVPLLSSGMTVGLGAGVGLLLLAVMIVSWRQGRLRTDNREASLHHQRNELLHNIAQLDDLYAGGQVDEATWRQQRADLKVQLLDVAARLEEGKL